MAKGLSFAAEKYLLDSLNRIAKNPSGYAVLFVRVSKLKPKNRHPGFLKIFAKMFDGLVGATDGLMFILSTGDFAILGKNISSETVDLAVQKLQQGLSADPVFYAQNREDFAHLYEFPEDFTTFYQYIEQIIEAGEAPLNVLPKKNPITAAEIDEIINYLDTYVDVSEMVKRQSIMRIGGNNDFKVLFQEFFVAVKDLSSRFNRNIDFVANRWLFLYLTQTLDKKTIASFKSADIKNWPEQISLNLNLSSVFSKEFVDFAKNFLAETQKIIVEVQMMDVLNNLSLYFEAKELLNRGGHKLLIDGLSPETLRMLNLNRLEPDYIKIFWNPMMEFDMDNAELKQVFESFGRERIILAKCTDEKAIRWGVKYGLNTFQGPYIDMLEVALVRAQCPHGKECQALDCLKRRRLLSGYERDKCKCKDCLEKILGA